MITQQQLAACVPGHGIDQWYDVIVAYMEKFEINTPLRMAHFLAQCGHESGDLREIQENLNYSAKGLRGVFPKYFPTDDMALHYQRNPEMIANRVYGGRMGNGPEETGEGFRYHGRGLIQLTGKDNYRKCSHDVFGDDRLVENPDLLATPEGAVASACWYWTSHRCNQYADQNDVLHLTKLINGGTIGLDDRTARTHHCLAVLGQ